MLKKINDFLLMKGCKFFFLDSEKWPFDFFYRNDPEKIANYPNEANFYIINNVVTDNMLNVVQRQIKSLMFPKKVLLVDRFKVNPCIKAQIISSFSDDANFNNILKEIFKEKNENSLSK